jgi:hypothetical protein
MGDDSLYARLTKKGQRGSRRPRQTSHPENGIDVMTSASPGVAAEEAFAAVQPETGQWTSTLSDEARQVN